MMKASNNPHNAHAMHPNLRELISQRWNAVQYVLIPELSKDFGEMTPKLEPLTHTLEWVRPEAYCTSGCGKGRKPHAVRPPKAKADEVKRSVKWQQGQRGQSLAEMLSEIPTARDVGTKKNAKGYKRSWRGYKLHIDAADCGVPVTAILSSASMLISMAAIPLSLLRARRVTNLYDVMDAGYCSLDLHEHCRSLGHVPLIAHNPRGGEKIEFEPADAVRYRERTVAERMNARLKDEFGGRYLRVRGYLKAKCRLMFGLLALSAGQLMRLRC